MDSSFDTGRKSRQAMIFGFIVVFHIALIWLLNSSLSRQVVDRVFGPIQTKIIEEIQETEDEPPPPPPVVETPPPFVPPPDINFDLAPPPTTSTAITQVTSRPTPPAPPPVQQVVKKAPEIDPRFRRRFQPEYPPTSRRLNEEGSVVLQVLVDAEGRVQDAKVQTSSGHPRLDEAALNHAKRAWRFTPGTEDGKAVTVWHSVRVTFKITN